MIDLEFDDAEDARGLLAKMERIWAGPGKDVLQNPVAWIVESVETVYLQSRWTRRVGVAEREAGLAHMTRWS